MIKALIEGFFLGISTGSLCLMTCTPVYLPYIMTSDRKLSRSLLAVGEISLGRFISYLSFGAAAGFLGANISSVNRNLFGAIANILLAVYLALTVLRTQRSEKKCHVPKMAALTRSGLLLGILTGINFCPAFLIALTQAVNLGGPLSGLLLFLGFFVGTTLYLIPLAFASLLTQINKMKYIARILSLVVAVWFISKGAIGLVNHFRAPVLGKTRIIDVFHPSHDLIVIYALENIEYFSQLRDSLAAAKNHDVLFLSEADALDDSLITAKTVFFIDATLNKAGSIKDRDVISVSPGYNIASMRNWLQKFTFQSPEPLFWEFYPEERGLVSPE